MMCKFVKTTFNKFCFSMSRPKCYNNDNNLTSDECVSLEQINLDIATASGITILLQFTDAYDATLFLVRKLQ